MRPELVQASELLRRNTPEAAAQAIELLQNTVYSFSMKICGHREDAEDIMQDVLFRSLGHLTRFPDPAALIAWLYTVTKNRCRRVRRPRSGASARTLSLDELIPTDAELNRLLSDRSDSPEHRAIDAEQHNLLHQTVLQLPPKLRVVLVLHDMEELSTEQVAQILGLQTGTVSVRLHRARLTLRKEMNRILKGEASPPADKRDPSFRNRQKPKQTRSANCRELFATLSEYLDGRVTPATCEQIEAHMNGCPNCVAFLNDLRDSIHRCRSMKVHCDPAIASRLRTMLTQEYLRMLSTSPGASTVSR
jgi:RNA polymerase sigma-70 factor (ECF subfamily)